MIEAIRPEDLDAVLALNNANAEALSYVTRDGLAVLIGEAAYSRRIGGLDAFLIAFNEGARYDSPNYLWFSAMFPQFTYVDRVVVAAAARGRRLATMLYDDLFAVTRETGRKVVCCEVNSDPPNPESDAFHQRLGFEEMGSATIHGGAKQVRYLVRLLA